MSAHTVGIVGGSGFIGLAVAKRVRAAGWDVTVLDPVPPARTNGCQYRPFDMRDPSSFPFRDTGFSAVVIAAGIMAKGCNEDPDHAWGINVTATLALLARLAEASPRTRVVFLSSGMVYDGRRASPPFDESAPTSGACVYTKSKLRVEAALREGQPAMQLRSLILRPFTVYGEEALSHERGHLFGRWLELGRRGEKLTVYGDGSQVIDPVHVDRIGEACLAYLERDDPDRTTVLNITSGGALTLQRLAELFVEAGLAPGIEVLPAVQGDTSRGWGDATALERLLGRRTVATPEADVADFLGGLDFRRTASA